MQDIEERIKKLHVYENDLAMYYSLMTGSHLYELGKTGVSVLDERLGLTEGKATQNKYLLDAIVISSRKKSDKIPIITDEGLKLGKRLKPSIAGALYKSTLEDSVKYIAEDPDAIDRSYTSPTNDVETYNDKYKADVKKSEQKEEPKKEEVEDDVEKVELEGKSLYFLSFISNKVDELVQCYESLYGACYKSKNPVGVLTSEGIYTLSGKLKEVSPESKAELFMVYDVLTKAMGKLDQTTGFQHRVSPKTLEVTDGKPLYINYHLANMFGYYGNRSNKSTSFDDFKKYISKRVTEILKKLVNDLSDDQKEDKMAVESMILQYIANLKNCILVDEYQKGVVLKLRVSMDDAVYPNEYAMLRPELFQDVVERGYLFKKKSLIDSPTKVNDVFYLNFIVDESSYYNSPLFAYEALPMLKEQGIELSWDNILIGKDVKDDLVFGHFGAEQKTIYNIMAGSGSGKGVMTLSLLASALAANIPVMYADCKPDMAQVLWDTAGGREVLAFDGDEMGTLSSIENKINIYQWYNELVPEPLKEYLSQNGLEKKFVKTYCYVRCMHLCYLMSVMRKEQGVGSKDFILFIFDEVGRVGEQVKDLTLALQGEDLKGGFLEYRKNALKTEGYDKLAIANDESIRYATGYIDYMINVISKIVTAKTAELRLSNSKLLFIWQPDWLKKAGLASISSRSNKYYFMSVLYKLTSDSNTVKFAGKGSDGAGALGMHNAYVANNTNPLLFDNYRYFAMADSGEITSSSKVFRPFLLLNDSTPQSAAKCVATNPLAAEKVYVDGDTNSIVPEIGFANYVNTLLNGNIQEPLCRSWQIAEDALESLGYERNIYKFMYDVSDIRLNLSKDTTALDSTQEEKDYSKKNISELLNKASEEDDFSDEDAQRDREQARLSIAMGEYKDNIGIGDLYEEGYDEDEDLDLTKPLNEASSLGGSVEVMDDTQRLIDELSKRLGVNVSEALGVQLGYADNGFSPESSRIESINQSQDISNLDGTKLNFEDESSEIYAASFDMLEEQITSDVINKFGGYDRIRSFQVKGGSLAVNRAYYRCRLNKNTTRNVPEDIRQELNSGNITSLFNYGALAYCQNLSILEVDSLDFWYEVFAPELNISLYDLDTIFFKVFPRLRILRVGGKEYTREDFDSNPENIRYKAKTQNTYAEKKGIAKANSYVFEKFTKVSYNRLAENIQTKRKRGIRKAGAIAGSAVALGASGAVNLATATVNLGAKFIRGVKNLFD